MRGPSVFSVDFAEEQLQQLSWPQLLRGCPPSLRRRHLWTSAQACPLLYQPDRTIFDAIPCLPLRSKLAGGPVPHKHHLRVLPVAKRTKVLIVSPLKCISLLNAQHTERTNSECDPCSMMLPDSITTIEVAFFTVDKRCAIMIVVRSAIRLSRAAC